MVKGNIGIRFENFVAVSLLKHVNAVEDYLGKRSRLNYLRTKEKKEVDFVITVEDEIPVIAEVKFSDSSVTSSQKYFHEKYGFPSVLIVKNLETEYRELTFHARGKSKLQ